MIGISGKKFGSMTTFIARIDSSPAGNNSINLVNTEPALTLVFSPLGPTGNLLLENGTDAGAIATFYDPNTQVSVDGSAPLRFDFVFVGALPTAQSDGAGRVPDQFEDQQVVLITVYGYPTANDSTNFMFLLDQTGVTLANMDAFDQGNISVQGIDGNPLNPPQVCFLVGSMLETPDGPHAVEDLSVGDMVITQDGGPQPVVWITSSQRSWPGDDEAHKPILFSAGSLGMGLPSSDLCVSPQHHILIAHPACADLFGAAAVLAPAKGLTDLPGVRVMKGKRVAEYFHLMFAQHEIVMAHGVPTESFYPGPMAVRMLSPAQRSTLFAVVPTLKDDPESGYGPTARPKITRRQAEKLVRAILAARHEMRIAAE